jgi:hypothetical protein
MSRTPCGAVVVDDASVMRSWTGMILGVTGATDDVMLIVPLYVPLVRTPTAAGSSEMVAVDGLVPDAGDRTSHGSDTLDVHEVTGLSLLVMRIGSGGETCEAPEPGRWTANA